MAEDQVHPGYAGLVNNDDDLFTLMTELYEECDNALDVKLHNGKKLRELKVDAGRAYIGDHWETSPRPGLGQYTLNRDGNAIISSAANQVEKPVKPIISAVQTNDDARYLLTRKGYRSLMRFVQSQTMMAQQQMDPSMQQAGQPMPMGGVEVLGFDIAQLEPDTVLDVEIGEALLELTEPQPDPATGQMIAPPLDANELIVINDSTSAERVQEVIEQQQSLAYMDLYVTENQVLNNTFGDQPMVFTWDAEKHQGGVINPHWESVRIDPKASWIKDAEVAFWDQYLRPEIAALLYPECAEDIRKNAGQRPVHRHAGYGVPYRHVNFKRGVVVLRTMWLRNVPFRPLLPEEALAKGLVEPEKESTIERDDGTPVLDDAGEPVQDTNTWRLKDNGAETAPAWVNWPNTPCGVDDPRKSHTGILQVQVLWEIEKVVDKRECPLSDIPLAYSKNIMIPYSPHGMGEPFRLGDVQQLINRLLTILANHAYYYQYPEQILPLSLKEWLGHSAENMHSTPGRVLGINDDYFDKWFGSGVGTGFAVQPPQPPREWIDLLQLLMTEHDRLSGQQQALQGEAPTSDASGRLVEALANNARGIIAFKSKYLEWMVEWITRLWVDAMMAYMPDDEWERYLGKYAKATRLSFLERVKGCRYDIRIEAAYGRATRRELEYARAEKLYGAGAITLEEFLRMMDVEHPKDMARQVMLERQGAVSPEMAGQMVDPNQQAQQADAA